MRPQDNTEEQARHIREFELAKDGEHNHIEVSRKVFVINLFAFVGAAYLFVFGFNSLRIGHGVLGWVLLSTGALAIANFVYLKLTADHKNAAHVMVLIMTTLFVYLIASGGVEHTGPLWCYVFSPLILFVYGSKRGFIPIATLFAITALVLFFPNPPFPVADYPQVFKTRFLASFLAVTAMSYVYELSRDQAHKRLAVLSEQLYDAARTDTLTGLFNRRAMLEMMKHENSRALRTGRPYTILLADLDDFKAVNDTLGHDCGDDVLRETSRVIRHLLRIQDSVARWGGEEFLVLLPDTDAEAAGHVAEKIRGSIQDLGIVCAESTVLNITISIGSCTADLVRSIDDYVSEADVNLYRAKECGKNQCVISENPRIVDAAPKARPQASSA